MLNEYFANKVSVKKIISKIKTKLLKAPLKNRICYIILLQASLFQTWGIQQQQVNDSSKYLLLDIALQLQITDAVDNMYNFKFHQAEVEFAWLKYKYPDHPLPYFLYGISAWWQMMPNLDADTPLGDKFLAYMDTAIVKSKALLKADKSNVEASFFLAGAHGFKGRYHAEKKNWGKAAVAGKKALKYLKRIKGNESFSPEILFGEALFNYYSIWIRENYPMLRPILFFFPKGDKELGAQQMERVSRNAFYTRVEAIYFLMRIRVEEKKTFEALRLAEYIHQKYPDNPYFHRFYARMLYTTGQYVKTQEVSGQILRRIAEGQEGYEEVCGRYASFYLGHIASKRNHPEEAQTHFEQVIEYAKKTVDQTSGYYLFAQYYLARCEVETEDYDQALKRISIIRKNTRRRNDLNKKARKLKKEIRQMKRKKQRMN